METLSEQTSRANLRQWAALTPAQVRELQAAIQQPDAYRFYEALRKEVRCDTCGGIAALEEVTICPYTDIVVCPDCLAAPYLSEDL